MIAETKDSASANEDIVLSAFLSSLTCSHSASQLAPVTSASMLLPSLFGFLRCDDMERKEICGDTPSHYSLKLPSLSLQSSLPEDDEIDCHSANVQNTPSSSLQYQPVERVSRKFCTGITATPAEIKHTASRRLSQLIYITEHRLEHQEPHQTVAQVPVKLLQNVCATFQSLLDKRFQATAQALLKQQQQQHNVVDSGVMDILSSAASESGCGDRLAMHAASLKFARVSQASSNSPGKASSSCQRQYPSEHGDCELGIKILSHVIFQATFAVKASNQKQLIPVQVNCPGQVALSFANARTDGAVGNYLGILDAAKIQLDTSVLLDSMLLRCRELVYDSLGSMIKEIGGSIKAEKTALRLTTTIAECRLPPAQITPSRITDEEGDCSVEDECHYTRCVSSNCRDGRQRSFACSNERKIKSKSVRPSDRINLLCMVATKRPEGREDRSLNDRGTGITSRTSMKNVTSSSIKMRPPILRKRGISNESSCSKKSAATCCPNASTEEKCLHVHFIDKCDTYVAKRRRIGGRERSDEAMSIRI